MESLKWETLSRYLSCPDDGAALVWRTTAFECPVCQRDYPVSGHVLDVLPKAPLSLPFGSVSEDYANYYKTEFRRKVGSANPFAFGAPGQLSPRAIKHKVRQVTKVLKIITQGDQPERRVFCDLTGAAGHYTFAASAAFKWVIHCDLSLDALLYASERALKHSLPNILFLRIDYLQLPFRGSIDRLICMDTLIRGPIHEGFLLRGIQASLTSEGKALVDFHNWWHNPFRRLGLLPDNFVANTSYSRQEVESLLEKSGITRFQYFPFHQEWDDNRAWGRMRRYLIPPTRLMYEFSPDVSSYSPDYPQAQYPSKL